MYLLGIIPFYYIYFFIYLWNIDGVNLLLNLIISFIISFILYYYSIWNAWDAKYVLVLSLFIPNTWMVPFIWNIALITIIYLFLYFFYFYFWKCFFNLSYFKSLYKNIYVDLSEKFIFFIKSHDGKYYKKIIFFKILKWILLFLIFFVSIRLARLYIINDIKTSIYYIDILKYLENYFIYILLAVIFIFIFNLYIIRLCINKFKTFLYKNVWIKNNFTLDFILIWILLILLMSFIGYEYSINANQIQIYLIQIFTIYIWLYWIFIILRYSYKITFQISEENLINIKDLKIGDIVDKQYLVTMFWKQYPKDYFLDIERIVDNETKNKLQDIYTYINKYHEENKTEWFNKVQTIKILKTFSFGGYIFLWFILTYFISDTIYKYFLNFVIEYFKIKYL